MTAMSLPAPRQGSQLTSGAGPGGELREKVTRDIYLQYQPQLQGGIGFFLPWRRGHRPRAAGRGAAGRAQAALNPLNTKPQKP